MTKHGWWEVWYFSRPISTWVRGWYGSVHADDLYYANQMRQAFRNESLCTALVWQPSVGVNYAEN